MDAPGIVVDQLDANITAPVRSGQVFWVIAKTNKTVKVVIHLDSKTTTQVEETMLKNLLEGAMKEKNLSSRDLGAILDLSHTTILKALQGDQVDLTTLIKMAEWLKIRPSSLLDTLGDGADIDDKILVLSEAYPELRVVLEKAAEAVEAGQADPAIIKDIVAYVEFRIQSAGG
jgi:transcriptional regulator with XRE-family HTH domain